MEKIETKKPKLSLYLNILGILMLITGLIFFVVSIPNKKGEVVTLYKYNVKRNVVPQFTLKEESGYYYDQLVSNVGVYPASAVDKMALNMSYNYYGDRASNLDYTYSISAQLIGEFGTDTGNSAIWRKDYVLLPSVSKHDLDKNGFLIDENVDIDYQYFSNLVREYKNTYQLAINAYLRVKLNVTYTSESIEKTVNKSDIVEVNIPLNDYVSEVKKNYQENSSETFVDTELDKVDYVLLYIGVIFLVGSIILFITANNKKEVTKYSKYKKNIDRVLKEYGDLIVTVTNKPNIKHLQVMGLATLDDLVDVADQNKCHIIRYEILKKCESFLLVIHNGFVYVYVVTEEDLKFAK